MSRVLAMFAATLMILLGARLALAHGEPIRGEASLTPAQPRVGEEARIVVSLHGGSSGAPLEGAEVKVVGEMTGHTMTPVEASLVAEGDGGQYSGTLRFTMAGPWNLRLQIAHQGEHAEQVIAMTVLEEEGQRDSSTLRQVFSFTLEGDPPPYPLLVLGAAGTLIVGLVTIAIVRRGVAAASEVSR